MRPYVSEWLRNKRIKVMQWSKVQTSPAEKLCQDLKRAFYIRLKHCCIEKWAKIPLKLLLPLIPPKGDSRICWITGCTLKKKVFTGPYVVLWKLSFLHNLATFQVHEGRGNFHLLTSFLTSNFVNLFLKEIRCECYKFAET